MSTSFKNLKLFFYKFSFTTNTVFLPLQWTLYAGRIKSFVDASEICTRAVFQLVAVVWRKASSECSPQGAQKIEVGCQIGPVRTIFLSVWPKTSNSFFDFLTVCTYCSELFVALFFPKNFTNRISFLCQKSLPMSLPAEFFLPHSPYCSGLIPTDFHHSGPLNGLLRGRRFSDEDELQQRVHEDLRCFSKQL